MAGQVITALLALAVAPSAALVVHSGALRRSALALRRCAPLASDRISDTHRKHAVQKQQERQADEDRAERSQQQAALRAHRAAIEEFEVASNWRGTLNELHVLRREGIEPDAVCIEAAARTLAVADKWQQAAELAHELRSLGLQPSESQAAAAMVEALARSGSLSACLRMSNIPTGARTPD